MSRSRAPGWEVACNASLMSAIERLRDGSPDAAPGGGMLAHVTASFDLSPFERDILVLLAAAEVDPELAGRDRSCCMERLTFAHALGHLPDAHWSALSPNAPLRRWRLVRPGAGSLLHASIEIDELVLLALLGVRNTDPELERLAAPEAVCHDVFCTAPLLHASHAATERWFDLNRGERPLPLHILAEDRGMARRLVAHATESRGLDVWTVAASALPQTIVELDALARVFEREFVLGDAVVLLLDDSDGDPAPRRAAARVIERVAVPIAIWSERPARSWQRDTVQVRAPALSAPERAQIWRGLVGPGESRAVDELAHALALPVDQMREITVAAEMVEPAARFEQLRQSARKAAHAELEGLAQHLASPAEWQDLVLPEAATRTLREVAAHVRNRLTVERDWGFGGGRAENLSVTALFHGPSGVGKTLAARVLATELGLDLFRVDLSQAVSKYIGDTEKNLKVVFDAAERSGAVLVFDEADALFGKRSDVHDAHDRYANLEVSYLLQRLESYRGLAILTTNLPANMDPAFMRRIRYAVAFTAPDALSRLAIWRRAFPIQAPCEGLDHESLARLSVSGASISNIALGAAVLAAETGQPIGMEHVFRAAQSEYVKLGRSLSPVELQGWPATGSALAGATR